MRTFIHNQIAKVRRLRPTVLSSLVLGLKIAPFLTLLLLAYVAFNIWGLTYEELRQTMPAELEAEAIIGPWTINRNGVRSVDTREIVIDGEPDQILVIETRDPGTRWVTIQPPRFWVIYKPLPTVLCALTAFVFVLVALTTTISGVKLALWILRPLFREKPPLGGFEVRLKEAPVAVEFHDSRGSGN